MAAAAVEIPQGWTVNNSDTVLSTDPDKIYEEWKFMRERCPVAYTDRHNGYFILTKHEDIKRAAQDSETFISNLCAIVPADPRGIRRPPLKFDGKDHTPYRTALDRTLKASRVNRLEPILRRHATIEMRKMVENGSGDLSAEFGAKFSALVEKEWMNLDDHTSDLLAANVNPFVQSWRTGNWDAVKKASDGFYVLARRVIEDRKANPRDPEEDPASSLLLERDSNGQPLEEEHLVGCIRQSLIVAMVAPAILMAAIFKHLANDKDLHNKLRADRSLLPAALEEFIRLYTPYRGFARTAVCPVKFQGQDVPPEVPITMTYAAANRDPSVFPHPDEFMLHRENITSHLGFGKGRHRCAGMPLARMIMRVYLEVLLENTSDFDINGELGFARLPEIGIISCPVRFTV